MVGQGSVQGFRRGKERGRCAFAGKGGESALRKCKNELSRGLEGWRARKRMVLCELKVRKEKRWKQKRQDET